jgi:mercuric reductase
MTCDACASHVTAALEGVPGVVAAEVPNWKSGRAVVTVSADAGVTGNSLVEALRAAGYEASSKATSPSAVGASAGPSSNWNSGRSDYDLAVIGTGAGGMAAAIKAAEMGRSVCVIEKGTVGGTCVNIGCVPSKTLIRASEAYHRAGHHPFRGFQTRVEDLDWGAVIAQKDQLVSSLRQAKYVDVLASYERRIKLMTGRARILPDGNIGLDDGRICKAAKIIIATGASPAIPPIEGVENVEVLTSTSAMDLREQPRSIVVIGGRFVALELGQTFARFGTEVTILQRSVRLIPEHEPEIAEALTGYLRGEGLRIYTGVQIVRIKQEGREKVVAALVDGREREFRADHVLMATGRTPNTHGMDLDAAGVELDRQGFILVDDHLKTSNPRIYAAGDVTNRPKLVYVAAAAGGIAAENALNGNHKKLDLTAMPDVIFTDPQVATAGLTEAEARKLGHRVEVSMLPLSHVPRALAARDTRGLIKLVSDGESGRLLGAQVLAAEAGEVIQTAALAIKWGKQYGFTYRDLAEMLFPYLTQVEGIKLAALAFNKDVSRLSCCAG